MNVIYEHPLLTLTFICTIGFWLTVALDSFRKKGNE